MAAVLTLDHVKSPGLQARKVRLSLMLTRPRLANLAGVHLEEVDLFEHDLPVPLDVKRKLLKELWARKLFGKV